MDARSLAEPPRREPSAPSGVRFRLNNIDHPPSSTPSEQPSTPVPNKSARPGRLLRQRLRIKKFQQTWENIKEDLPPQLSRSHIGMISIGGVIGTGLFLGSGQALYNGGPIGAFLAYAIIGTVVYCLCVSIGEMIAFLPNVGGVVGLADLFVDPALGFSLGWAAWYNWSVTLPAEISAATILVTRWDPDHKIPLVALAAIFLFMATAVNCFPSRVYGEFEFWFSAIKVLTIVVIIVVCLVVDLGGGNQGFIGVNNWSQPFSNNLGVSGPLGQFLGFWSCLLQACFSFFGSEVPGIAAGEVIDATRNVPRALQRVWIRITIFYVGAVFCAGLVVSHNDARLTAQSNQNTSQSSPFVIAFEDAGIHFLSSIVNAAILLSAWSAAASDIYISSRFLFFLAKNQHAPEIFSFLRRYPRVTAAPDSRPHEEGVELPDVDELDDDELQPLSTALDDSQRREDVESLRPSPRRHPWFVLPLYAVLASASVGLLSFLSAGGQGAQVIFNWLSSVASIASLQSWLGMLYTYIRWYRGTVYHEKKHSASAEEGDEQSIQVIENITRIKVHRHKGQPWLAVYALSMCMLILLTNGWTVFLHTGWRIGDSTNLHTPLKHKKADVPGQPSQATSVAVSTFLSSYVPIPFFILLTLGYKIIYQTRMVRFDEMDFQTVHFRREEADDRRPSRRERVLGALLVI
ncbi:amino acid permease-domain-containing protein [Cytidiella melzeri]|nr:amino acid permease-domain-containing protein [Cytidiella melzeri]